MKIEEHLERIKEGFQRRAQKAEEDQMKLEEFLKDKPLDELLRELMKEHIALMSKSHTAEVHMSFRWDDVRIDLAIKKPNSQDDE